MKYILEGKNILLKYGLILKKIEIDRITKIKLGRRKCAFFEGNKLLLSCKVYKELYDLADILFEKFSCVEIEFDDIFVNEWRKIDVSDFDKEIDDKKMLLDNLLGKFKDDAPFELSGELEINNGKYAAVYNIKGLSNGKQVIVSNGKESVEWGVGVPVTLPHIINRDTTKIILMVNDSCCADFELYMTRALRYANRNGYHTE